MSTSAKLLIAVLALAGAVFFSYQWGARATRNEVQAEKLAAVQRAIQQAAQIANEDAEVATDQEQTRERIRTVYRTITQEVEKNVAQNPQYAHCGLDADGLRDWNAANTGDTMDGASQRDAGVSGSSAGPGRQPGERVPQPRGSDPALSRLPVPQPGQGIDHPKP